MRQLTELVDNIKNDFVDYHKKNETDASQSMNELIPIPKPTTGLDERFPNIRDVSEDMHSDEMFKGIIDTDPKKNPNFTCEWMESDCFSTPEYAKPRMFTLNQIKDLVHLHLSRSELRRMAVKHDVMLKFHDDTIFDQGRAHKKLKEENNNEFETVYKNVENLGNYVNELNKMNQKNFKDLNRFQGIADKKLQILKQNDDDFKVFQEMISSKAERYI